MSTVSSSSATAQTPCAQAFECISATDVASLNVQVQHFRHRQTGAEHYHLACDHDEKAFLVALRTMPGDSTGVAHILEHTALCGSEKYPVRDPFFMMTRRSLNTFMNAMTSSDWTAYPFASQNDKDFNNLLDVYLDAVFFSRLDPLDFAQEGHRLELEEKGNKASPLVYKGVVFNEMKGAMSSPVSQLWQGISSYLFPTTTYHHNSGGEPSCITDLSYQQLLDFYKSHYHPSNAIFMTFGDLDVTELQQKLDSQALSKFERQSKQWRVQPEKRFNAPLAVTQAYGVDSDDLSHQTHHVLGWLLGDSTDLDAQLEANLLSQVLLDNSASPLRKALEQSDLGGSPSPLCGLEDSNREMSFMCGIEGSEPEHAQALETLVLKTLQQVANDGVDQSMVDAALHQLELHQREIGGDSYPYGLQLIFNAIPAATHYGDPVQLLNLDPALARLKQKAAEPNFIQHATERLLLNNRHRVLYSLKPDAGVNTESARLEQAELARKKARMSDQQLDELIEQTEALEQRQAQEDDPSLLPQVTLADVRPQVSYVAATQANNNISEYHAGTNGLVYQQLLAPVSGLNREQLTWLPFFTHAWTEVGAGGNDYLAQQQKQTALVGSLSAYTTVKASVGDADQLQSYLVMSAKALADNTDAFTALNQETWQSPDFSDSQRLLDLLTHTKARKEQGLSGNGHGLAMSLAAAPLNRAANLANELGGLPQAKRLKQRVAELEQDASDLSGKMTDVYQQLFSESAAPQQALLIHDSQQSQQHLNALKQSWGNSLKDSNSATGFGVNTLDWRVEDAATFWQIDSQVSFCAWAIPTVTLDHPDSAALAVAGGILRNGFLHTAIRERGGAYGAGASQDSTLACFKFFSYRDPRIEGTFADFAASIDWLLGLKEGESLVEQAILGIIGSMDRPGSPAGEAKQCFHLDLTRRTQILRQNFRQQLLAVRFADVQRVVEQYLRDQSGQKAVVAPRGHETIAQQLGLMVADY